jgi:penicillin-binding protein 2
MPIFQDNRVIAHRLGLARLLIALVFLGLCLKLWHLMVIRFDHYRELAEKNQVRTIPLMAPRGPVLDRDGRVLVENINSFNLFLYREEVSDLEDTKEFVVNELDVDPEHFQERLDEASGYPDFRPLLIKENLSMDEVARLLSHQSERPELKIFEQPRRLYRYGQLAAHVLGFVGEVSRAELDLDQFKDLKPGDVVGKTGIERVYNRRLTGTDGFSRVLVNSAGKALQELARNDPQPGAELRLTLDLDLQRVAEEELGDQPGAVIALDPRNGDVLVLASRPAFDPNWFATRITEKQWEELTSNPDNPLQNRAIQNAFSPGSIFKVVMALGGLEAGIVTPQTSVYCNGGVELYGHYFHCWKAGGHGFVHLSEAIQHSCNTYFYLLGQKMGIDRIAEFARRIGLGVPTGIDLPGEISGLVPSSAWKERTTGHPWYAGETISVAIGQGQLNVTPAQLARAIGAVATGRVPKLKLVDDQSDGSDARPVGFSLENLQAVRNAMWKVVNEYGTGREARVANFDVCGKTGTAQTISRQTREKLSEEEQAKYEPNAWFVGFAPREDPEIVVAVIVQRGGSGGSGAAPIAGRVLQAYYRKYKSQPVPGMELAAHTGSGQVTEP